MNTLPSDGSIFDDLYFYNRDNKAEDEASLDNSPNQSNTSSSLPDEDNMHVFEGYMHVNPLLQSELNDKSMQYII